MIVRILEFKSQAPGFVELGKYLPLTNFHIYAPLEVMQDRLSRKDFRRLKNMCRRSAVLGFGTSNQLQFEGMYLRWQWRLAKGQKAKRRAWRRLQVAIGRASPSRGRSRA